MASSTPVAHRPPSALGRAATAIVLLLGFYVLTLGIAAVLFILPCVLAYGMLSQHSFGMQIVLMIAVCWIAGALLVMSLFDVRRAKFDPPRRRLKRADAPALFDAIKALAERAGTEPPHDVYLVPMPDLSVTEVGGLRKSRRVLILGAPLLSWLTVDELRSGIAHELGHFTGGDTRFTTLAVQTHALFAAVVEGTKRDPFRQGTGHYAIQGGFALAESIAKGIVRTYGRLYLRITRSTSRRQELAADALSASLVGGAVAARALEKVAVIAPMYMEYLGSDVARAIGLGAMPTDLTAAFDQVHERKLSGDEGRALFQSAHERVTSPFDTHPALADRVRALSVYEVTPDEVDARPASSLFADGEALDAWILDETRARLTAALASNGKKLPVTQMLAWSTIASDVYPRAATADARHLCERLHSDFPNATTIGAMFASVWRAVSNGRFADVALRLHPALANTPRPVAARAAVEIVDGLLAILLQAAILERGGAMDPNLGDRGFALHLGDERIVPRELLHLVSTDPPKGRAALDAWAARLEAPAA